VWRRLMYGAPSQRPSDPLSGYSTADSNHTMSKIGYSHKQK